MQKISKLSIAEKYHLENYISPRLNNTKIKQNPIITEKKYPTKRTKPKSANLNIEKPQYMNEIGVSKELRRKPVSKIFPAYSKIPE